MRHLITIEGNIGSGKTTMLTKLQEWITKAQVEGVATVKEPVDLWQQPDSRSWISHWGARTSQAIGK